MKKIILILLGVITGLAGYSQSIDSIFFHLYTDSLKKGTHNYINVDGKLSNGRWMPLTGKDLTLTASSCRFEGNELVVPANFSEDFIVVKAVLKSKPSVWIERKIWIKKREENERLPTAEEVIKRKPAAKKN